MRRGGFTLMEVNLAMFIMAAGTLGLISLYTLGYRENRQSLEDVRGAAVAESNMNQLMAALSSTNLTWSTWTSIEQIPSDGWGKYAGNANEENDGDDVNPLKNPTRQALSDFNNIMSKCGFNGTFEDGDGLAVGLVVLRNGDRMSISMRSGLRDGTLLYQPLYFTEVRFQGLRDQ